MTTSDAVWVAWNNSTSLNTGCECLRRVSCYLIEIPVSDEITTIWDKPGVWSFRQESGIWECSASAMCSQLPDVLWCQVPACDTGRPTGWICVWCFQREHAAGDIHHTLRWSHLCNFGAGPWTPAVCTSCTGRKQLWRWKWNLKVAAQIQMALG